MLQISTNPTDQAWADDRVSSEFGCDVGEKLTALLRMQRARASHHDIFYFRIVHTEWLHVDEPHRYLTAPVRHGMFELVFVKGLFRHLCPTRRSQGFGLMCG